MDAPQPRPAPSPAPPHAVLSLVGRGDLAFLDLHGEPLYLHCLRALTASARARPVVDVDAADRRRVAGEVAARSLDVEVVADGAWWTAVRERADVGLLAVDALCPLVTAAFLEEVAERAAAAPTTALVACRPVTDTLKAVDDDRILGTVDRDALATITSPVVVPAPVLVAAARDDEPPPLHDFGVLVGWLRERADVELVRAPSLGRRVEHARAVHLLEHIDQVGHRVRVARGARARSAPKDPA